MLSVSDVRIFLSDGGDRPCRAYAKLTLNGALVITDLRVVSGHRGGLHLSFPCRKGQSRCPACAAKNPYTHRFCHACGDLLPDHRDRCGDCGGRGLLDHDATTAACPACRGKGFMSHHIDVVFPIHNDCRAVLEGAVLAAYREAVAARDRRAVERTEDFVARRDVP